MVRIWRWLRRQDNIDHLEKRVFWALNSIDNLRKLVSRYRTDCKSLERQKNRLAENLERSEKQSARRLVTCLEYQSEIRQLKKRIEE